MTRKTKQDQLYDNLSKVLVQYMEGKRYTPLSQTELFKKLSITSAQQEMCKQILADLVEKGVLFFKNRKYGLKTIEAETVKGILRVHPRGFGFLQADDPTQHPIDIFIPKQFTDNAVDGDHVEVEIAPKPHSEKGPEGKVVAILKRGRTHLAGTVHLIAPNGKTFVHCPLLGSSKPVVVKSEDSLKVGDRIVMKVLEWGDEDRPTQCEMTNLIGHISDPSCDIKAAVEEFDLSDNFPKAAIEQAKQASVSKKEIKARTDLTKLTTITIDPTTSRDFDDALSLTKDSKGHFHLGVHIADVAHFVPAGSPLDLEAQQRCNSTYFPGACLPMLPEQLSNILCSLVANEDRLTVSVLAHFDKQGTVLDYKIVRSVIKSVKRFTYEEAKQVLDGEKKSDLLDNLNLMVELCLLLKKKRYERGSIDFSLPDLVLDVDEKGQPHGTHLVAYDITHQLVEEFMLKANELVAKHLADQGKQLLFRIHEQPSLDDFQDFFNLARSLGFPLPKQPTTQDLQALFEKVKNTPFGQQLSVGFIRSMKLAAYSPDNVGHYGLALEYYTHFTSPIRRYIDLVIQRLLFNEEGKVDLEKIALKCSEQERVSFRAESSVKLLKKLRLLSRYFATDPGRIYNAIVTRIKPFGLFFELPDLMLEGFLHISELENDYFTFNLQRQILVGSSSGKIHAPGESLTVKPVSIDLILLEAKWALVTSFPAKKRRSR
jgi:ribonuclease R